MPNYRVFFHLFRPKICVFLRDVCYFWQKVKKVLDNSIIRRDLRKKVNQIMPYYRVFFRLFRPIIERCLLFFVKKSKKYSIIRRFLRGKSNFGKILANKVQNCMYLRRDHTYKSIKSCLIIKYFFDFLGQ